MAQTADGQCLPLSGTTVAKEDGEAMMRMKAKHIMISVAAAIAILSVGTQPCHAGEGNGQGAMTLRDCMLYAVSNSTKVRIQEAAIGDARIDRRAAILAAFTPTLDATTYAYYNFGRSIDPETNTYKSVTSFHNSYGLSAGINLFDGFEAVNNLRISKTSLEMGNSQMAQVEADICLATMEAYYNVVYYTNLSEVYARQVENARKSVRLVSKQDSLGIKGHADVVQMQSELADREYDHITTVNLRNDAMTQLQDVMFWPVDSVLTIDTSLPEDFDEAMSMAVRADAESSEIIDYAQDNDPSAKVALGTMMNAKREWNTARWQLLPTLGFYAGWSTTYYSYPGGDTRTDAFRNQFKNNAGEYLEATISIPIFGRLQRHDAIAKKKHAYEKASAEYDQKLRDVAAEVGKAVMDRDGAEAAYCQAQRKAEVQEEAYHLNGKKFEQGLISSIEYQTATDNYLKAQADRMDSMLKFFIKNAVVRYYNGERYENQ